MKKCFPENPLRKIEIYHDECPVNPFEDFDLVFQFHLDGAKRYFYIVSPEAEYPFDEDGKANDGLFVLPVYAYIHSGIVFSLAPFSDKWDSGLAGYIYVEKDKFRKDFQIESFDEKRAMDIAEGEIELLNQYESGDVWGYQEWTRETVDGEWKEGDSCWGFFGKDGIEDAMKDIGAFDGKTQIDNGDCIAWQVFD